MSLRSYSAQKRYTYRVLGLMVLYVGALFLAAASRLTFQFFVPAIFSIGLSIT